MRGKYLGYLEWILERVIVLVNIRRVEYLEFSIGSVRFGFGEVFRF